MKPLLFRLLTLLAAAAFLPPASAANGAWELDGDEVRDGGAGRASAARSTAAQETASLPKPEPAPAPAPAPKPTQWRRPTGVIPPSSGAVIHWGVLLFDTPMFTRTGKRLPDKAIGGTLVEIEKFTRTSTGEEMALCSLWGDGQWEGPVLVATRPMTIFTDPRDEISTGDLANLMEYCYLGSAMDRRRAELERAVVDANPYAERVRELAKESKVISKRSKALTKERDHATGAQRNALTDELRELQIRAASVTQTLNQQINLYNRWRATHPSATATVVPEDDSEWRNLKARKRALAPAVEKFGVTDFSGEDE